MIPLPMSATPLSRPIPILLLFLLFLNPTAQATLRLAGIFTDHVVLQRDQPVTIWGWADPAEEVTVTFAGQAASVTATDDGSWQARLDPLEASDTGRPLTARAGGEMISVGDVLVGEVWHASGQSNMAMSLESVASRLEQAKADLVGARHRWLRFRRITEGPSLHPKDDLPVAGGWKVCDPESAGHFSAAAFYFALALQDELGVPVGVIDSSRGGTPIEPYIPRSAFNSHPTLGRELELGDQNDLKGIWRLPGGVYARDENWLPARLFHSRLSPITRFAARGTIWYQAESNCGRQEDPRDYQHKLRALITGWRDAFGNPSMPFYFVQLPGGGAGPGWPYMREQQRLAADLPHTGMVVTIDLLDNDIHPANKLDVGRRLARWALSQTYRKRLEPGGPLFLRADLTETGITVHFSHAGSGLILATKTGTEKPRAAPDLELTRFELADSSGVWHPARAVIEGSTVLVTREELPKPIAVRYGYAINPQDCHLYNRDLLPASPFCSRPDLLDYDPGLPRQD